MSQLSTIRADECGVPINQENCLACIAQRCRFDVLEMLTKANSSHVGCCFSVIDILVVLYHAIMNTEKIRAKALDRDYFILSKGHAAAALYVTLASAKILPSHLLQNYHKGPLAGHPCRNINVGIEASTGSLGQGLSMGVGIALAAQRDALPSRVFVLVGDGECQEGAIWEALMMASRCALSNLTVIVDYNNLQGTDRTDDIMPHNWTAMFVATGCTVYQVNGHDYNALAEVFGREKSGRAPTVVIAHTTKGKGVDFMENKLEWHYKACTVQQFDEAKRCLDKDCV